LRPERCGIQPLKKTTSPGAHTTSSKVIVASAAASTQPVGARGTIPADQAFQPLSESRCKLVTPSSLSETLSVLPLELPR
jgi:hypothetical protein